MPALGHRCETAVPPSRFVKRGATEGTVAICDTAGEQAHGISQQGTRNAPFSGLDDGLAGDIGDPIEVTTWEANKRVPRVCAGGTIAVGDQISTDAAGKAIATASQVAGDYHVLGIAEQAAVLNELVLIKPALYMFTVPV